MTLSLKTSNGNTELQSPGMRLRPAFEYDDVCLIPRLSSVSPRDVCLRGKLTGKIGCDLPLIASPMDSVVSPHLSEKLVRAGSVPVLLSGAGRAAESEAEIRRLKAAVPNASVGVLISPKAAISGRKEDGYVEGADVVFLDTLHSAPDLHLTAVSVLKGRLPDTGVVSGNVVHPEDAAALVDAGVDAVRVGMTSASINDGYSMTGCARSQAVAVHECAAVCREHSVPVLADGGIRNVGQLAIAFALGADTIMMGRMFAALAESAAPFDAHDRNLKTYRGMSRNGLVDPDLLVEGRIERIEVSGAFDSVVAHWRNCLKVAVSRCGAKSLEGLRSAVEFEIALGAAGRR
jgi:IMP dehydrogenase/GMP reductase